MQARASLGMIAARLATTFSASSASFAPVPLHIPVVVGAVMGTLGARVVVDLAGVEPSILSEVSWAAMPTDVSAKHAFYCWACVAAAVTPRVPKTGATCMC